MNIHASKINKTAISPYDYYCDGYACPGAQGNGYISVVKVATGKVEKTDDFLLDGIVAYDRAEANDAYIGQINMETASSFCGVAGQVWGYDLATADVIAKGDQKLILEAKQYDGSTLAIYDGQPLIDAGIELFGTEKNRRFPPAPGAHVICVNKSKTALRPNEGRLQAGQAYGVWCYIALSIAKDRDQAADLFIEDAGLWTRNDNPKDLKTFLEKHRAAVVWSIVACGKDHSVLYDRTYISFAYTMMKPGEIGTALTVAPYVTLARKAIPSGGFDSLNEMTLSEWVKEMGFDNR
ncbi:MAG: histidine decarboxylase, pyruvoyl type [Leptolyngbyaceae cyanobacterium MO_188.B28]|nr:histidine decarboxylase, pyruvoyl type [Leptolyngbyaceae cyanobacterium MO_188.B28]